jgi:hypothetical protein
MICLEHPPAHPESIRFIRFLEESGAEHVASYLRWAYFRKKAADGPFEIYSDTASRIKHLERIIGIWLGVGALQLGALALQMRGVAEFMRGHPFRVQNVVAAILLTFTSTLFFIFWRRDRKKLKRLRQQRDIYE